LQIRLEHRRICNSAFSWYNKQCHAAELLPGFRFKTIFEGKFKTWVDKAELQIRLSGGRADEVVYLAKEFTTSLFNLP